MSRDEIWSAAMALPAEDRQALAHDLLGDTAFDPEIAVAWEEEILRRVDEIDQGHVAMIPAEQVFDALRDQSRALRARRAG